ncbi:2831_t:CDS:2 [Entrophospora sp. SA101]|nr:2831_t:CDS:2 [Entrophospora sp. SA101]
MDDLKIFPIQSNKNVKKLGGGKWLELEEVEYTDPNNVKRTWEFCPVDIHAIIEKSDSLPVILLVIQYRPPIKKYCIELPSAALREFNEETGYTGTIQKIYDPICYEPGLTDSSTRIVDVKIDSGSDSKPIQTLDEDEWSLQVIKVPLNNLLEDLQSN